VGAVVFGVDSLPFRPHAVDRRIENVDPASTRWDTRAMSAIRSTQGKSAVWERAKPVQTHGQSMAVADFVKQVR
jgi:hypothetical protein